MSKRRWQRSSGSLPALLGCRGEALIAGVLIAGALIAAVGPVRAAAASSSQASTDELRVVAAGGVPFVVGEAGGSSGLSLDVWRAVADRARLDYSVAQASSVDAALSLVLAGQADVAVGPISITADRARRVAFSQPYFQAGLAILSRKELHPAQLLAPFFSPAFAAGVAFLLCVLGLVGALIWLAERRSQTRAFPDAPGPGIATGIWFALVTMTTVGYGDFVPKSPLGRVVAAAWMLIAVLSLSSLTAGITSSLTLAKLETGSVQSIEQLRAQRVAAVRGSTGARFVHELRVRQVEVRDLEAAVDLLVEGDGRCRVRRSDARILADPEPRARPAHLDPEL